MILLIIYFFQVFRTTYYPETQASLGIYLKCMTSDYMKKLLALWKLEWGEVWDTSPPFQSELSVPVQSLLQKSATFFHAFLSMSEQRRAGNLVFWKSHERHHKCAAASESCALQKKANAPGCAWLAAASVHWRSGPEPSRLLLWVGMGGDDRAPVWKPFIPHARWTHSVFFRVILSNQELFTTNCWNREFFMKDFRFARHGSSKFLCFVPFREISWTIYDTEIKY